MNFASTSTNESEDKILAFVRNSESGITDKDVQKELPHLSNEERMSVLNHLVAQGLIGIYNTHGDKAIFRSIIKTEVEGLRGADNEEKVVYRIVEEAGNKGIWIRDIRVKSNLIQIQLNKIIKNLESKKLIKSVRTVTSGKKKVLMLYNLEPDRSLTGGAWYSDQDFESEYVDVLNQQCYGFLEMKKDKAKKMSGPPPLAVNNNSYAPAFDVWKFINESGISKIQLSEEDIETILTTLIYDGRVEKKLTVEGKALYKAIEPLLPTPGVVRTPCGICPVFRNCDPSCSVNPKTCSYYNDWLA